MAKRTTPAKRGPGKPHRIGSGRKTDGVWQDALDAAKTTDLMPDQKQVQAVLSAPTPSFAEIDPALLPDVLPYSEEEPWGRYENETAREYELFDAFLNLGLTRTRQKVVEKFKISRAHVDRVAKEFNWEDRATSFDDVKERVYTTTRLEEVRDMAKYHAAIARKGVVALASSFEALIHRMEKEPDKWAEELSDMSVRTLFSLAHKSAQVLPNLMNAERLSQGLPTEVHGNLSITDHRITITTSDDIAGIVAVLANALGQNGDSEEGVLVIDGREIEAGEGADPTA